MYLNLSDAAIPRNVEFRELHCLETLLLGCGPPARENRCCTSLTLGVLAELTCLEVPKRGLESFSFTVLPKLDSLNLEENSLTKFAVHGETPKLRILQLGNSRKLVQVQIGKLHELTCLYLNGTSSLDVLELSDLPKLKELHLTESGIADPKTLEREGVVSLERLYLNRLKTTKLDFVKNLPNLKSLVIRTDGNEGGTAGDKQMPDLDLSPLLQLKNLTWVAVQPIPPNGKAVLDALENRGSVTVIRQPTKP